MGDARPRPAGPGDPRARSGIAWIFGIRTRIFLSLALLATALLLALSFWIERQARRELEGELEEKLQAVAASALFVLQPGLVPALLSLSPAEETSRTYRDARTSLTRLRDLTHVRRIFLADLRGRSFVDTDPRVTLGSPLIQLRTDRAAIQRVEQGSPAAAPLFTDDSGDIIKKGYSPVEVGGEIVGVIGVEADATFLSAVRALRARIVGLGIGGILLAFLLAAVVARGLTRPLERLVRWARRLGSGDLSHPVPVGGRDEIALLGRTLEQMRDHLESQDRELRAMVAGVAHEIRNPLGGMRIQTELLASGAGVDEAQRARVKKILGELDQLGNIVEEFLLYARPAKPAPETLDLDEVVDEITAWLRPEAEARGGSIRIVRTPARGSSNGASSPQPSFLVEADPTHLRQMLRNLLRNALEASPDQPVVWVRYEAEGRTVRIRIEDEGPGLDPGVRERIFEPFFSTKAAGAGLGLPIVQRLTLLNQGRLEVGQSPAGGAAFELTLPRGRSR